MGPEDSVSPGEAEVEGELTGESRSAAWPDSVSKATWHTRCDSSSVLLREGGKQRVHQYASTLSTKTEVRKEKVLSRGNSRGNLYSFRVGDDQLHDEGRCQSQPCQEVGTKSSTSVWTLDNSQSVSSAEKVGVCQHRY